MDDRKDAYLLVSPDLIEKALKFPECLHIFEVGWDRVNDCIKFTVTHPSLRDIPVGELLPTLTPNITTDGNMTFKL